jgi:murein DD-endopeptidase MepM/ murein hydrolase activator NlpD
MEEGLVTFLTLLIALGVIVGMSTQAAAVEGVAKQPADLLNIGSEPDDAGPDNEAAGQGGGQPLGPWADEPRLGQAPAGTESKVGHPAETASATSPGELVAAPVSGRVVFAAPFKSYGPLLIIAHDEYHTVLWGFAQLEVVVDDLVIEGQTLGLIRGESGTAPILHVEIRRDGRPIDLNEEPLGGSDLVPSTRRTWPPALSPSLSAWECSGCPQDATPLTENLGAGIERELAKQGPAKWPQASRLLSHHPL